MGVGGEVDLVADSIGDGAVLGREVGLGLIFVGVARHDPPCPLLLGVRLQVDMLQQCLHLHLYFFINKLSYT